MSLNKISMSQTCLYDIPTRFPVTRAAEREEGARESFHAREAWTNLLIIYSRHGN